MILLMFVLKHGKEISAVIIIGIAFSKLAKDSTTALYPARFACEDSISID